MHATIWHEGLRGKHAVGRTARHAHEHLIEQVHARCEPIALEALLAELQAQVLALAGVHIVDAKALRSGMACMQPLSSPVQDVSSSRKGHQRMGEWRCSGVDHSCTSSVVLLDLFALPTCVDDSSSPSPAHVRLSAD